jgi:HAE1 family hydrophobic/amphiphilic exporter-1
MVVALGVLVASVAVARLVKQDFLPDADQGRFSVEFELPAGTSLEGTKRFADQLRSEVSKVPGVANQFTTIGGGPRGTVNKGSIQVSLVDRSERDFSAREAVNFIRTMLSDRAPAKVAVETPMPVNAGGLMRSVQVQYSLRGDDLAVLDQTAAAVIDALRAKGGYVDLDTSSRSGKPELSINIDRGRAASLGVPVAMAAMALRTLIAGEKVTELAEGSGSRIDVRMRLADEDRRSAEDLAGIKLKSTWGPIVELGNLVHMERGTGPAEIEHVGRQRQVMVFANLKGKALGEAVAEINAIAAKTLPTGVTATWAGLAEVMGESFGELWGALFLAVALTYLILAAQFDSLIHPFTIMLALPLSVVGAFGALAIFDMSLNIFSMIGFILLMGIVTKNGVLLVDYTNTLRGRGMSKDDALRAAGPVRLRPILMTSIATIIGMLPVALGTGLGGEMRAPMAVVVIGGLVTSTLLTLLVVPVVYSLLDRFTSRRKFLERADGTGPSSAPQPVGLG